MGRLVGESSDEGEHGAGDENSDGGVAEEDDGDEDAVDTSKLSCNFLLLTLIPLSADLISLVAM